MAFTAARRIDFPMIDMAGIVYYPEFWDLAHRFYEESWEHSCGMHYNAILHEHGIGFPLVHSDSQFLHPLAYGDTVHCTITVPKIGNTSISWRYEFCNQDDVLCWISDQVTVCVDMNDVKQKVPVPEWLREGLTSLAPE